MADNHIVSRLLRSPKTIRARLAYEPTAASPVQSNVTVRSSHQFLTDKYNPVPVSPPSAPFYTRSELINEPANSPRTISSTLPEVDVNPVHPDALVAPVDDDRTMSSRPTVEVGTIANLKSGFVQQKVERDQCAKDFTEFLGAIASTSNASASFECPLIVSVTNPEPNVMQNVTNITEMPPQNESTKPRNDPNLEAKTATLKLAPRENPNKVPHSKPPLGQKSTAVTPKITSHKAKPPPTSVTVDQQPQSQQKKVHVPVSRPKPQRQKSTIDIPLLNITSPAAKQSLSIVHTDRQPSSLQQSTNRSSNPGTNRTAPFDSARARKHMAEQLKKRRLAKNTDLDGKIALAERKRRLADLQQQTRKIVQRNLTKNAAKCARIANNILEQHHDDDAGAVADDDEVNDLSAPPKLRPCITNTMQKRRGPDRGTIQFAYATDTPHQIVSPSADATAAEDSSYANAQTTAMPVNDNSTHRRVGILRRTDTSPTNSSSHPPVPSPLNIHFDQLLSTGRLQATNLSESGIFGESSPRPQPASQRAPQSLQMPDVKLQTSTTIGDNRSKQTQQSAKTPPTTDGIVAADEAAAANVPYWLRPSPMQIYPYNFIMAVRKKLDLIANPTLSVNGVAKADNSSNARHSYFKKKSIRSSGGLSRKSLDKKAPLDNKAPNVAPTAPIDRPTEVAKSSKHDLVSDSDAITTLSSISLLLPPTNSRSLKPPANQHTRPTHSDSDSQATLSMSSAILSHSSPDKKMPPNRIAVEPLSTDTIAAMRLVSGAKSVADSAIANKRTIAAATSSTFGLPFVNCRRGTAGPPSSKSHSTRRHWSGNGNGKSSSSSSKSAAPITLDRSNIMDMLDSFNRSLSHAISVNQQLHDTLNRPAPQQSATSTAAESSVRTSNKSAKDEYSSQFDSTTSSLPTSAKAANASESTSLLENESGIPLTATTRNTVTTESIPTDLSQFTESARSNEERPPPVVKRFSDLATASTAASVPTTSTTSSVRSASSAKLASSIVSCIRPQIDCDDISSVSTAARHFDQSYSAAPSVLSVDAHNSLPAYASPLSTDRLLKPETTSPMLSSTTSTLTIKSMRIDSHNEHNKENVSVNSNEENTARMMADTKRPAASADVVPDLNQSIGSDIFAVFNQTDIEFTSVLQTGNSMAHSSSTTTIVSEANVSYATLGMYDRLLKTEDQKSLDLTALLKVREKALMDRTKGQIAWLELQKQKYQQRGLTAEMSAVKKKQRALLLRLERDRAELAKSAKHSASHVTPNRPKHAAVLRLSHLKVPTIRRSCSPSMLQHTQPDSGPPATPKSALRAIDFAADTNVEAMLQQREDRLRHRRAHVESLVRWHQRLDDEECAVAEMEAQLMERTNQVRQQHHQQQHSSPLTTSRSTRNLRQQQLKRQRRQIQNIEHSLEILHALPSSGQQPNDTTGEHSATTAADVSSLHGAASCDAIERVPVSGSKMNRLWQRLTGETGCKFIPDRRYELSKADIADVYEEAKRFVLGQFGEIGRRGGVQVLDQSMLSALSTTETIQQNSQSQPKQQRAELTTNGPNVLVNTDHHPHGIAGDEFIVVPALNLNFTSTEEHSLSASDAGGGCGGAGVHDSYVSGFYFTDNVPPMQPSEPTEQQPQHQPLFLNKDSTEWDDNCQSTSANSLSKASAKTFYIQPTHSNSLRDSAFSVDSLNSSRPEVSEAAALSIADDWQPSSIVELQHSEAKEIHETTAPDPNLDATMLTSSAEPTPENPLTEQTMYIDDISCPPHLMEISTASISAPTIAVDNNVRDNSTTTGVASEDNDQQQHNSYSDSFEPTATITTSASDKIAEAIETADIQQQVTISNEDIESTRTISEDMDTTEPTSGSVPMSVGDQQLNNRTVDAEISSQDISECISSVAVDSTKTDEQPQSPAQSRSVEDKPVDSESPTLSSVTEQTSTEQTAGVSQLQVASVELVDRSAAATTASPISPTYRMPDIISEAEVLRRQQIRIEEEIKQLEEENAAAAPFVYIREIPNKPPPPYVPPAHGSPMTAIFPSDTRIQFIVYRRVKQLLDSSSTDASIVDEQITNIYERIALDICAEVLDELPSRSAQRPDVNDGNAPLHFKHPLAFYNPPDRLQCMQQHVLQRVKKLLRHPHAAANGGGGSNAGANSHIPTTVGGANDRNGHQLDSMDTSESAQHSINYVKRLLVGGNGNGSSQYTGGHNGAKRKLWWNEILLQEMMEDDATWTNFDAERVEVLDTVGEEIMRMLVAEALVECERTYERKAATRSRQHD